MQNNINNIIPIKSIKDIHKFILYVAIAVFLGSLFFPIYGYNIQNIQPKVFQIIIAGFITWFIIEILQDFGKIAAEEDRGHSIVLFYYSGIKVIQIVYIVICILTCAP